MVSNSLLNHEKENVQSSAQTAFNVGRLVGILLLLQLVAALTLPFILSKPITLGSPAFLTAVAEHSFQIRSAILISFVGSALTVYLGITTFQILRIYSKSVAILFLVVCAISCTLDVVQAETILSMLSISNQFVASSASDSGLYQVISATVASERRSAHMTQLLAIGAWMIIFYISLFCFKLIPRVLSAIGIIGVALQFIGVTLMMFLGYRAIGEMAMPLLPIQISVAVYLIIKGFYDQALKPAVESEIG